MIAPIIKEGKDLTPAELKELNAICRNINSFFPENHVEVNHIEKTNPIFYLFKVEEKIVAFHVFSLFKAKTPFSSKEIPVIYINLSFKTLDADAHIKNYAKWSNNHFLKAHIGRFWYFKEFLLCFLTNNPKLAERSSTVFYQAHPLYSNQATDEISSFCSDFVANYLKVDAKMEGGIVLKNPKPYKMDISNKWEKLYEASQKESNDFFINNGIIIKENNNYFLTGNQTLFMGYSSLSGLLKNVWKLLKERRNPYKLGK